MTKRSRGRKYGFSAPHGLSNGKKVTVYLVGGAERWGEDWRLQVFFYGWKGKPPDEYLLYRHTYNSKVLQARQSNIERIEEGWNGVAVDVRQAKQHEVERQVKKANEINKAAPVTVTIETKETKMRRLPNSVIDEAIDFLDSDADMTQHDMATALGIGHGSMTAILKAYEGADRPKYNSKLYERTQDRIAIRRKNQSSVKVENVARVIDVTPTTLPEQIPMSVSPLDKAVRSLSSKRQALKAEMDKLDAKIQMLLEIEEEYFA